MNVGDTVYNIAVSRDGRWIVSGTESGKVQAWNTKNGGKLAEFTAPFNRVEAVDVSPDSTKIARGSNDKTVRVWSFPTGQKLHEPWRHYNPDVSAVKFSPDRGRLIATAIGWWMHTNTNIPYNLSEFFRESVQVYNSQDGHLLVDVPIIVKSSLNQTLSWSSNSEKLLVLSTDDEIYCLSASTGTTLLMVHS